MQILNNYVESALLSKNPILKASDWVLTPWRKSTHFGKRIEVIDIQGRPFLEENSDTAPPFKRVLWAVLAVATSPLAAIAAFFKLVMSPSVGTSGTPFTVGSTRSLVKDFPEAVSWIRPLKKAGLSGQVRIYLAVNPEQQQLTTEQISDSIIQSLKQVKSLTGHSVQTILINEQQTKSFVPCAIVDCNF